MTKKDEITEAVSTLIREGIQLLIKEFEKNNAENLNITSAGKKASKKSATKAGQSKDKNKEENKEKVFHLLTPYQAWYTKSLPVVKQILPDRYQEFVEQYKFDKRKEVDWLTYTISDYLIGLRITRGFQKESVFNPFSSFFPKFEKQLAILQACEARLSSVLADIQGVLQAEMFDDELSAAQDLLKKSHLRASGALCGVILERHFSTVTSNHILKISKTNPTIADYNDLFKKENVYDVPTWRFIQRLGDLRNIAAHFKGREPLKDEIEELIRGTEKILKTVS
jgi:hypothetical protein